MGDGLIVFGLTIAAFALAWLVGEASLTFKRTREEAAAYERTQRGDDHDRPRRPPAGHIGAHVAGTTTVEELVARELPAETTMEFPIMRRFTGEIDPSEGEATQVIPAVSGGP